MMFQSRVLIVLVALLNVNALCKSEDIATSQDRVMCAHDDIAKSVALSRDGKYVASAGFDGKVCIRRIDQPSASPTIVDLGDLLSTIAFSRDGKYVYAGGNYSDFAIAKIMVKSGGTDATFDPEVSGTIDYIRENPGDVLTIVSADNRITKYSLKSLETTAEEKIFGGFLGCISSTTDGAYVAVSSQNEKDHHSTEPCKLTIFDKDCMPVFSYQYEPSSAYFGSQHGFGHDHSLYLVTPSYIMKFAYDRSKKDWKASTKLPKKFGRLTAIAVAGNPARIWVARQNRVLEVDPDSGKIVKEYNFQIGPKKGVYAAEPINSISVNADANLLAAACQDGTVRLSSMQKSNKPNDTPTHTNRSER